MEEHQAEVVGTGESDHPTNPCGNAKWKLESYVSAAPDDRVEIQRPSEIALELLQISLELIAASHWPPCKLLRRFRL
jgi:hypothetical protein